MKKNNVSHDTVPYFMERFAHAYTAQLQDFAQNVLLQRAAKVTIDDGLEAIRVAVAAQRSYEAGRPVAIGDVT
jgi:predicted dehydrogenase